MQCLRNPAGHRFHATQKLVSHVEPKLKSTRCPFTTSEGDERRIATSTAPSFMPAAASRNHARAIREAARNQRFGSAEGNLRHLRIHSSASSLALLNLSHLKSKHEKYPINKIIRLAAHTLVHALLRAKKPIRAAWNLQWMLFDGMHIRHATFNAVLKALVDSIPPRKVRGAPPEPPPRSPSQQMVPPKEFAALAEYDPMQRKGYQVLILLPSAVAENYSRHLLGLLIAARHSSIPRPEWAYHHLICSLLKQHDFVTATLVIDMLARDWQVLRVLDATLGETKKTPLLDPLRDVYERMIHSPLPPSTRLVNPIISDITKLVQRYLNNHFLPPRLIDSIWQGIALLLGLLHRQQLPMDNISPLLEIASMCLTLPARHVWVWLRGPKPSAGMTPQYVKLSEYARVVIQDFIGSLPAQEPAIPTSLECLATAETDPPSPRSEQPIDSRVRQSVTDPMDPLVPQTGNRLAYCGAAPVPLPPPQPDFHLSMTMVNLPKVLPPLSRESYDALFRCAALHPTRRDKLLERAFNHMTMVRDPPFEARKEEAFEAAFVPSPLLEAAYVYKQGYHQKQLSAEVEVLDTLHSQKDAPKHRDI
ncbi:hypothetical protein HGRIS_005526 [Hohenbuehelia grisea]|uniref:Rho-GAP domain-containing protein n=1 Tax=Hohenbuehelia grisea TaxID=104357 RepID=A0ABR3JX44_9AGAR